MATLKECGSLTDYKERLSCEGEWMQKFMDKNLRRPEKAPEDVTGTVYVQCTITETGKVTGAKIMRGIHPAYDAEALRVVGLLPDFIPAQNQGKPMAVVYNLPVRFK